MRVAVGVQIGPGRESFGTLSTSVRALARVRAHVGIPVNFVGKSLVAEFAGEPHLSIRVVRLHVVLPILQESVQRLR